MTHTIGLRGTRLVCLAETAQHVMTPNPLSISLDATVREAAAFLIEANIGAAPVINEAGRPVGVLSRSDIVRYQCAQAAAPLPDSDARHWWSIAAAENGDTEQEWIDAADATMPVHEIMTPALICVPPDAPLDEVIHKMLGLRIQSVFVIDDSGVLIGTVGPFNILRAMGRCPA